MDFWGEAFQSFRFYLLSMSERLRDVNLRIRGSSGLIIEHLLFLYFYRDSPWDRDWMVHIYKAVSWVPTMKGSRKFPPEDWLYDCLFGGIEDAWGRIYKTSVGYMNEKFKDWNVSVLKADQEKETFGFVRCYMLWLARRLHGSGEISLDEVIREIKGLLVSFPFDSRFDV
jgi:hypothetical protein